MSTGSRATEALPSTTPSRTAPRILRGAAVAFAVAAPLGSATAGLALFLFTFPFIYREARVGHGGAFGPLGPPAAALIGASFLSALFGLDPGLGMLHTLGLVLMAGVGLVSARAVVRHQTLFKETVLPIFVLSTSVIALYALYQYFGMDMRRPDGFLSYTNRLGTLLVFFGLLGSAFLLNRSDRRRWSVIPYGILVAAALGTTQSRAGWLAGAVGLGVLALRGGRRALILLLVILLVAMALLGLEPHWADRMRTMFSVEDNMERISMWLAAIDIWQDYPVTGAGPGTFLAIQPDYMDMERWGSHATPHNIVFNLAAGLGTLGLIAFGWLMARAARIALHLWRRGDLFSVGLVAAVGALFVNDLFGQGFFTFQIGFVMWFALGMLAAHNEQVDAESPRDGALAAGGHGQSDITSSAPSTAGGSKKPASDAPRSVSVIVPVRNRAQLIKPCLESLIRVAASTSERGTPVEIVVVNDASSDGTAPVVNQVAETSDLPVRKVDTESRQGPARARNAGIEAASGELVIFVDSDELVEEGFFEAHLAAHSESGSDAFAVGRIISVPSLEAARSRPAPSVWDYSRATLDTANASVRKTHLDAIGGFDKGFEGMGWQDLDLGRRLKQLGLERREAWEAISYHIQPPIKTQAQLEARLTKERERGRSALYYMSKHPGLTARLAAQDTGLHVVLNWLFRMGGLVRAENVLAWAEWARRRRLVTLEKILLAGVINKAHLESLAAAQKASERSLRRE